MCETMSAIVIGVLVAYFALLMVVSRYRTMGQGEDNDSFFMASRGASWWMVSIGMIGASVSGVSFVSVPGMVQGIGFKYLQTALGFILGYVLIANVLLPVYYRLESPSIYDFLRRRFGVSAYKTGAWYFLVSKLLGTAAKVYVIVLVLHALAFEAVGMPFGVSVAVVVGMIWLYTRRGGLNAIVWTDVLQTVCMVVALVMIIVWFAGELGLDAAGVADVAMNSRWSDYFEWDDWTSKQHFVKQFVSGAFIALVMTGLDQDMIQKNRAIRTLEQSKRNMYCYGVAFVPLNFLFLLLGVLLLQYADVNGVVLPAKPDEYLPFFVKEGYFGVVASVCFVVGVVSATFSSADSSLTSLTTSYCVDIAERRDDVQYRKKVHVVFSLLLVGVIGLIRLWNDASLIDLIYVMVSYTYGPLLGLFAFGLFTSRAVRDRAVPYIAIASPLLCYVIDVAVNVLWGYRMGYELLLLNGAITYGGLWAVSRKQEVK